MTSRAPKRQREAATAADASKVEVIVRFANGGRLTLEDLALIEAIRAVYRGERYFNDNVKKMVFEDFYSIEKLRSPKRKLPNQLTQRESEVLGLVASGKSNREVAEMLEISVKTVETHKTHILIKLGLNNSSELVRFAIKNKIISV